MATKKEVAFFTVAHSFLGALHGDSVEYHKGEVVDSDDPALKLWPEHFQPLVVREHLLVKPQRHVEQATAAPGEKRA